MSRPGAAALAKLREWPGPGGVSEDLSRLLGARTLVRLVLEAVQTVEWDDPNTAPRGIPGCRPQMMLTLLTYCYAAGYYGSQDIEWATQHDKTVRYICARTFPDWRAIRRFRRANREAVRNCLVRVFREVWALRCAEAGQDPEVGARIELDLARRIESTVQERLELAVILDRVALEA